MMDDALNEDWLRTRTWDVRNGPVLVTTLDQLFVFLNVMSEAAERKREQLEAFIGLPVWTAAPAELRADVERWLAEYAHRGEERI
jgi:hypothetical protein